METASFHVRLRGLINSPVQATESEDRWLDRLPVGTLLSAVALSRFQWPVDPYDNRAWLVVGCAPGLDDEGYRAWLTGLPNEGVLIDPSDDRLQRLLAANRKSASL